MEDDAFLFELSGEHPTLPEAEVISCLHAECGSFEVVARGPGYVASRFPEGRLDAVAGRLALTHRVGRYLGSCTLERLSDFSESLALPPGSVSVRAKQFRGSYHSTDTLKVSERVGGILKKRRDIDLEAPDVELRILMSDMLHFYVSERRVDRGQYDRRRVALRPFFSPISLHPRYARALVNLSRVRRGERLLDPFCGTGGILIEASLVGARALGSDISEEMVEGCKENMSHFGAGWEDMRVADVGRIRDEFGLVDAIVTDPPYGRSATTRKEPPSALHRRAIVAMADALREAGTLAAAFPAPCMSEVVGLDPRENHVQRVHRSLIRHYCVFTRRR